MGIGISLKGLKNKFNELMGRDKKKDDTKKSSESLESKEETRFDDTSPIKSKKTTASTDLDNTKNGASSGSVNSGEVHVEGLGQTTPAENTAPSAKQPSAGSRPPMPPFSAATNQTQRPGRLPPPPLPQNFSDPQCQKLVIEKFLKGNLSKLIDEAKKKRLLDDSYNYNENIKCYGFDYPACKFLENVRVFWLKIAKIIYREIPSDDISYEIINFQNEIGNSLQKKEMQSLLSTEDFVEKSNEFLKAINEKIDGVNGKKLLEDKKSELIESKGGTLNKLVSKYNELYKKDQHKQYENKSLEELQQNIAVFWLALKAKFRQGEKYEERKKRLDAKMEDFSTIESNREMSTFVAINNVGEALDQKFNIIGRVILYLEKRKNKEVKKQAAKDSGILGGLVKRFTKTEAEKKTLKLKKCFEDMGKYLVKHKGENVKLSDFRKLVKCKNSYSEWNEKLNAVLNNSNVAKECDDKGKIEKKLLMSILFFSFAKFKDEKDIIAACDGLKAGGIKSNDADSFEGKATSIRKAIKGKCATLDMAKDKDDLKNDIKTLCAKYFGLDMNMLKNIGNLFDN